MTRTSPVSSAEIQELTSTLERSLSPVYFMAQRAGVAGFETSPPDETIALLANYSAELCHLIAAAMMHRKIGADMRTLEELRAAAGR